MAFLVGERDRVHEQPDAGQRHGRGHTQRAIGQRRASTSCGVQGGRCTPVLNAPICRSASKSARQRPVSGSALSMRRGLGAGARACKVFTGPSVSAYATRLWPNRSTAWSWATS